MFHADLREEVRFLKARLLYKVKKLDEAVAANSDEEKINKIRDEVKELEAKLQICHEEIRVQDEEENEGWKGVE